MTIAVYLLLAVIAITNLNRSLEMKSQSSHTSTGSKHRAKASLKTSPKDLTTTLETVAKIWVSDIMQKNPITVNLSESLDTATGLLSDNNIRHLPVIDKEGDIHGIISDRDLLNAILQIPPGKLLDRIENPWVSTQVRTVMTKTPETVTPETTLVEAGAILLENKISCLPVVEGNHLVGIITSSDFVKLVSQGLSS